MMMLPQFEMADLGVLQYKGTKKKQWGDTASSVSEHLGLYERGSLMLLLVQNQYDMEKTK